MVSLPIFAQRPGELYQALSTSPGGLTPEAVAERQALYGFNLLSKPERKAAWKIWLGLISHPMALVLWVAGIISLSSGQAELGIVIWGVILINAAFSYWREYRAEQAVSALQKLLPKYARVIRADLESMLPASELVPGDILRLAEGDSIPADARVIEEFGLRVNNSTLTGEAIPTRKMADASLQDGISEIERPNLVFAGTSVVSGTAKAVVFATGMLTQFGRLSNLTERMDEQPSQLQATLLRITRVISWIALAVGAIVFFVSYYDMGMPWKEALLLAIGILVAALPEGLIPTVTLALAMSVQRLAQRRVLVKKLSVIETLGTISVICTDKSGTLTQNQMTVRELWAGNQSWKVTGSGYNPAGQISPKEAIPGKNKAIRANQDLEELLHASTLCNNARLIPPRPEFPEWASLGDPTEAALQVLALKGGLVEGETLRKYPRIHELPFDARRKRMSTIHQASLGQIAFIKGAPKEILNLCTGIHYQGEMIPLDRSTRDTILATIDAYARRAFRVLALARRDLPTGLHAYSPETVETQLTFLGLVAMMDPPRPEVADAVQELQAAGIRLVMITGDYGLSAESMARRLGMLAGSAPRILTGNELDQLSDEELATLVREEVIYARMAPEHKLRLVAAFQAGGDVVAVIGDGVNDAPALRKADVGIAMGRSGTDVSKEAADIILMEDNFAGIPAAIQEGRAVFDNLRKFITYIFSSNIPEIAPFLLTALFDIPLALTVIQILAIDLGTDLLPALALSTEKPEPDVMQRPPRRKGQPLIDRSLLSRSLLWLGPLEMALCLAGFALVFYFSSAGNQLRLPLFGRVILPNDPASLYLLATTVFHAGVVTAQIGNAFACRREKGPVHPMGWFSNPMLLLSTMSSMVILLVIIYLPPFARIFQHGPIPPVFWAVVLVYAPVLYILERGRKFLNHSIHHARKIRREGVLL